MTIITPPQSVATAQSSSTSALETARQEQDRAIAEHQAQEKTSVQAPRKIVDISA